jgi:hypothetical protein
MTLQAHAGLHEVVKVRIELRRATRDIYNGDLRAFEEAKNGLDGLALHHLFASWPCFHMTVKAGLVAISAHVDLEHVDCTLAEAVSYFLDPLSKGAH